LKNKIISANGSIQNIQEIPDNLKMLYRTAWELSQKAILDMAADRGAYICQSQSLNVFMASPNFGKLSSMHFYAWERGLKTGMYYLRSKASTDAIKFTVDSKYKNEAPATKTGDQTMSESMANARAAQREQQLETLNDTKMTPEQLAQNAAALSCSLENPDSCEMCSG
ncbi:MAG: ribonucleoside-diphosphate reductase subunit alpha, partial [Flavobacteriales bacterium]